MELFRIGAEPRSRIVGEHSLGLLPQARAQDPRRRAVVGALDGLRLEVEVERLEDLGPALAVGGSGAPERLLQPAQRLLVPVEELDLELLEAPRHALVVEHRDRVVDDLGSVRADPLAPGAKARDRQQLGAAQVTGEQPEQLGRRLHRGAFSLELEPRPGLRQLQLPEALAVLHPVPQRDPAARQPVVGAVVVGRDEEARLDRLAAELGQAKRFARA